VDFFLLYVTNSAFSFDNGWLRAVFHYHFFSIPVKTIRYSPITLSVALSASG
jgi:hypothetical protein